MRRLRVSVYAWVVAAALGGCAAGEAEYGADVRVTAPELVTLSPGVQVIADADEPLFYTDGYYWLYRDNTWYRSDSYRNGFARIDVTIVPNELRQIDRPYAYVHYRQHAGRAYARGSQIPSRQPARPMPQPQRQQQQPAPMQQPQQPQQPRQPMTPAPTPNAIPGHEGGTPLPPEERPAPVLPQSKDHSIDKDRDHDHGIGPTQPDTDRDKKDKDQDRDKDKDSSDKPYRD